MNNRCFACATTFDDDLEFCPFCASRLLSNLTRGRPKKAEKESKQQKEIVEHIVALPPIEKKQTIVKKSPISTNKKLIIQENQMSNTPAANAASNNDSVTMQDLTNTINKDLVKRLDKLETQAETVAKQAALIGELQKHKQEMAKYCLDTDEAVKELQNESKELKEENGKLIANAQKAFNEKLKSAKILFE